jgi:hypothetical protein
MKFKGRKDGAVGVWKSPKRAKKVNQKIIGYTRAVRKVCVQP